MKHTGAVKWYKFERFPFRCIKQHLISELDHEENVLALSAQALLFHEIKADQHRDRAITKLKREIDEFVEVEHSGMQLPNCLAVASYLLIRKKLGQIPKLSSQITTSHLNHAMSRNWFDNPRLPALVLLSSQRRHFSAPALSYLSKNMPLWLKEDNSIGVLCYCLTKEEPVSENLLNYLQTKNWGEANIESICWALLCVRNLIDIGHKLEQLQVSIVEQVYNILWKSGVVRQAVNSHSRNYSFTPLELSFALYALTKTGFDQIIGFPSHQEKVLMDLLTLRNLLQRGGAVVSKRLLHIFQATTVGFLAFLLWILLKFWGIETLASAIFELLFIGLVYGLGRFYFRKGLPASEALSQIFGPEPEFPPEDQIDE